MTFSNIEMAIFPNREDYTWNKALWWGNYTQHRSAVYKGSLGNRVIHALIAAAQFFPIISQIISIFEKKIADHFVPSTRSNQVLTQALRYSRIKELYDQANGTPSRMFFNGPWKIEFVDDMDFKGRCYPLLRKIYVRSDLSDDEAISTFTFELTNAINSQEITRLVKKVYLGQISCEEFAKEAEQIEYNGQKTHHEVISSTFLGLFENLDPYAKSSSDFKTCWENIKNSRHTNAYRKQWKLMRLKSLGFAALLIAEIFLVISQVRNKMSVTV